MIQASIDYDAESGIASVSGAINFSSVPKLYDSGCKLLRQNAKSLVFDFSKVTSANSAALSLLLSWSRFAKKESVNLSFDGVPKDLMEFGESVGVTRLLKFSGEN